jgi:hypothetical protein
MIKINKNHFFMLLFIIIFILVIIYYAKNKIDSIDPFAFFNCTLNLENVTPQFKQNYLKFNNKNVMCGPCEGATLKVNVNTCSLDENGVPLPYCKENAKVVSSFGNPIIFKYDVTPQNISKFFCINLEDNK